MIIVHVANIKLNYTSGMGRIASYWKERFLDAGHQFYHIGADEVSKSVHINIWGYYANKCLKKMNVKPDIVLVHEPHGGFFISKHYKTVIFSHGIEERAWQMQAYYGFNNLTIKNKLFPASLRFLSNNRGIKHADLVLLSNQEDVDFLKSKKNISTDKLYVFKNGYLPFLLEKEKTNPISFLFNATWIARKGTNLMYEAFNSILSNNPSITLTIAGTSLGEETVLSGFDADIRHQISVIPKFNQEEELILYKNADIFLMPSYFEGQSVALTQAMAMGLCPLAAKNCGQKDFITHQENGLLFETGNVTDFKDKLLWIIENSSAVNKLGIAAKHSVINYTWEYVTEEIVKRICV